MIRRIAACLLLLGAAPVPADPALDAEFPQSSIVVMTSRACHHFDVYLALTTAQQRRGLMHVRNLDPRRGMLFVYDGEARRSMWMKNTLLPLDMLFIRGDGRVATIVTDTEPQSLRSIASRDPVRYVLELNAGTSAAFGIREGDVVLWQGDVTPPPSQD